MKKTFDEWWSEQVRQGILDSCYNYKAEKRIEEFARSAFEAGKNSVDHPSPASSYIYREVFPDE
jgi:hypothetical protein